MDLIFLINAALYLLFYGLVVFVIYSLTGSWFIIWLVTAIVINMVYTWWVNK